MPKVMGEGRANNRKVYSGSEVQARPRLDHAVLYYSSTSVFTGSTCVAR
jgi:hypothetical protein